MSRLLQGIISKQKIRQKMTDSLVVDPAGIAPASSGVNTEMLTKCTTGPESTELIITKKTPFSRNLSC